MKYIVTFEETQVRQIEIEVDVPWPYGEPAPKGEAMTAARSKLSTIAKGSPEWSNWRSTGTRIHDVEAKP